MSDTKQWQGHRNTDCPDWAGTHCVHGMTHHTVPQNMYNDYLLIKIF
jgi:hypothetical protein